MEISTHDVQTLAHIVRMDYMPNLKSAIDTASIGGDLLQDRYDELSKILSAILDNDKFFIDDISA